MMSATGSDDIGVSGLVLDGAEYSASGAARTFAFQPRPLRAHC